MLTATVFLVYFPAWEGKPIWDDDGHLTKPGLRSLHGLGRIWIEPGAAQQYYPLVHSVFWLEYQLWGYNPLGYHLVNILLHSACAVLLFRLLRRLEVPGAWLAAALFALHPVQVETVAWITELKNTLSGVCYLGAALLYLDFDRTRSDRSYAAALALFLAGLLSKTVIATLPAALLVVFWWKRGRLSWRKDALPLLPFFVMGISAGLFTAWMERTFVGADPSEYPFSLVERGLIAGRALWFYLGKLGWPAELIFIYPRWHISQSVWWQYLFPLAAFALAAGLWLMRTRSRAPLAAFLFYAGTLFPALGFVNVFPFRYSFVADHFQYLATIGPIALAAAGITLGMNRWQPDRRLIYRSLCGALLLAPAILTWKQSGMYADMKTLWQTTIARNPDAWLAQNNLGVVYWNEGKVEEALALTRKALDLKADYKEAYVNLGNCLFETGDTEGAFAAYQKAVDLDPQYALARNNLGKALLRTGRREEAIDAFRTALQIDPGLVNAHCSLSIALLQKGHVQEAILHAQKALELDPDSAEAHTSLANAQLQAGRTDDARVHYREAIRIAPRTLEALRKLGGLLVREDRLNEALEPLERAVEIDPDDAQTRFNLGMALMARGAMREAILHWQRATELEPSNPFAPNQIAWVLATSRGSTLRDGPKALELAQEAVRLSAGRFPSILDTLAAAYAENQKFSKARDTARQALDLAQSQNDDALVNEIRKHLVLYERNTPLREGPLETKAE